MKQWNTDKTFLSRWLNNELTDEEKRAFEESEEGKQFRDLIIASKGIKLPDYPTEEQLIQLKSKLPAQNQEQKQVWMLPALRIAVAAVVIVAISWVIVWFLGGPTMVNTGYGESLAFQFPDGSEVILHASSEIAFDESDWSVNRQVFLQGEAFFKVINNEVPFVVKTSGNEINVLGTSFNVRSRSPEVMVVTCYEGKVKVGLADDAINLSAGNGVSITAGQKVLFRTSQTSPSWMNKISTFDNTPLTEVIRELEVVFGMQVEYQSNVSDLKFTGSFPHQNPEHAFQLVFEPFDISYEFVPAENKLIIK